jgi:hypothetical protein
MSGSKIEIKSNQPLVKTLSQGLCGWDSGKGHWTKTQRQTDPQRRKQ